MHIHRERVRGGGGEDEGEEGRGRRQGGRGRWSKKEKEMGSKEKRACMHAKESIRKRVFLERVFASVCSFGYIPIQHISIS